MDAEFSPLDADMTAGLTLSATDMANLRTAGKWGRFIAIVGMAMIGLAVLVMLLFGSTMLALVAGDLGAFGSVGIIMLILIYGGMFLFSFYIYFLLFRFSSNAVKAVDEGSGAAITTSFASLRTLMTISGILLVVVVALYALGFLAALTGSLFAGF